MARHTTSVIQINILEVALPLPATAQDIQVAIAAMRSSLLAHRQSVDAGDCFRVEAGDDCLYLRANVARNVVRD